MTPLAVVLLITLVTATDLFIVVALFSNLRSSMWKPLADAFPARPPAPDAVRREFQSLKMGIFNLGYCAHLTADAEHLHVEPAAFLRWFRMTSMSIPWDEVRVKKRSGNGKWITVRIRNVDLSGSGVGAGIGGGGVRRAAWESAPSALAPGMTRVPPPPPEWERGRRLKHRAGTRLCLKTVLSSTA